MSDEASASRRHFLTVATSVTGVVGLGFIAVPFLASFKPSTRAQALGAPVGLDISKLEPGAMVRVKWRGQPVWVLRRDPAMQQAVADTKMQLRDPDSNESLQPDYARNTMRSIRPEVLVVIGTCTHLGCAPIEKFTPGDAELGADWPGGFYCPCHGSKFDLAGRVVADVPAPTNLTVPPHRFLSETVLLIGADPTA